MTPIQSCQYLFSTALNSCLQFTYISGGIMLGGLLLKLVLSFYKTYQTKNELLSNSVMMPRKASQACKQAKIPVEMVTIVNSDDLVAASIGLLKPQIVISENLVNSLSLQELTAVVLHEAYHADRKHPLLIAGVMALQKTLVVLPVLKDLSKYLACRFECDADRYVINKQLTDTHLKNAMKVFLKTESFSQPAYFRNFAFSDILERIAAMQGKPIKFSFSKMRLVLSAASIGILMMIVQFGPQQAHALAMQKASSADNYSCDLANCASTCAAHQYQNQTSAWSALRTENRNMSVEGL